MSTDEEVRPQTDTLDTVATISSVAVVAATLFGTLLAPAALPFVAALAAASAGSKLFSSLRKKPAKDSALVGERTEVELEKVRAEIRMILAEASKKANESEKIQDLLERLQNVSSPGSPPTIPADQSASPSTEELK